MPSYRAHRVEDIKSLTPGFVQAVIKETGRPDNFIDSPEGSFAGIGDLETGASAEVISRLEAEVKNIGEAATQAQANISLDSEV